MGKLPERGSEMGEQDGAFGVRAVCLVLCLLGVAFTAGLVAGGMFSISEEGDGDRRFRGGLLVSGESDGRF